MAGDPRATTAAHPAAPSSLYTPPEKSPRRQRPLLVAAAGACSAPRGTLSSAERVNDLVLFVDGQRVFSRDGGAVTFDPSQLARARAAHAELGRILKGFK